MSLRTNILHKAASVLPPRLLRPLAGPVVLFFHGVEEQLYDPELQSNHHALEQFAGIATALRRRFEVAPISELGHALRNPKRNRQTVFLTSDDGYANTFRVAAPVLKQLGLPWTLFVSTRHIDTGEMNPMFVARAFLRNAPDGSYRLPHLEQPLELDGARNRVSASVIEKIRFLPSDAARDVVAAMASSLGQAGQKPDGAVHSSERFLSWEEVRALAHSGVAIGAHADWHWAMHPQEGAERLRSQAQCSRDRIQAEVGPCRHFAYPFGNTRDIGAAAWRAVRDAGYEYAFTTLGGVLAPKQNPWLLPRYGLRRQEPHLASLLPLLRLGNPRVTRWQASLN